MAYDAHFILDNPDLAESRIAELAADVKFLLLFAPDDCPRGLDPTFYRTLTYDGDKKLQDRVEAIRKREELLIEMEK
jgi:hypothetical protein